MVVQVWKGEGTIASPSTTQPRTRAEYDAGLIANADYFTLVRKTGPGSFERQEHASLEAARTSGLRQGGRWMIYAVRGESSCHVENVG